MERLQKHTLLSGRLLDLGGHANTDKTVVGLELLHGLVGVVDESETSGLATTVLGAETEDGDLVLVGLVELGQLLAELVLGDVGTVGVEDITERGEKALVSTWSDLNIEEIKLCRLPMLLDAVDLVCCSVPFALAETR
jgi:hypothetical protein